MSAATELLGFRYYAITHHLDPKAYGGRSIRLHNYPKIWAESYDRRGLYVHDPVHRASHLTNEGFVWSTLAERLALSKADRQVMRLAGEHGIADGFTIPVNIHGEACGSVTFVNPPGREMSDLTLIMAHALGEAAFAAARRIWTIRGYAPALPGKPLTGRQREISFLVALGKTDREMSMLTGLSEETPGKHVSHIFERYEVNKRTLLVSRALFDGTLTFPQVFPHFYSAFPE